MLLDLGFYKYSIPITIKRQIIELAHAFSLICLLYINYAAIKSYFTDLKKDIILFRLQNS